MPIRASVILATYDQPRLLDLALHGYAQQSARDFELVIADDGSGPETAAVVTAHARHLPVPVTHVWQAHRGFWKSAALNRAVLQSSGEQLIFSDGDCVPTRSFVAEHLAAARPNAFLVGGHVRLGEADSARVTRELVHSGGLARALPLSARAELWWTHWKSLAYIALRRPRRPRLLGLNFSVDRASFFAVNGFDQTYRNSARDDSDLRNRLLLAGVRPISLWHRARVVHLFHAPHAERRLWADADRYYKRPELQPESPNGLRELLSELQAPKAAPLLRDSREPDALATRVDIE
jgi:glycosyltransferase involved in cell wall biosynthesis